jgi:hypothetical protein
MSLRFRPFRISAALLCLFWLSALIVSAQDDRVYPTDDDAIIFTAPEGWTLDVYDWEAEQAELEEMGINITLPRFPGLSITLEPDDWSVASVEVLVYYGQDLLEFMDMIIGMMHPQPDLPTTPEEALMIMATGFDRVAPEDVVLESLTLPDGREVLYYDYVDTFDMSELEDLAFGDDMFGMFETGDDEADEMLQGLMEQAVAPSLFGDFDMVTTSITRYYALSFDNTGPILIEVYLGGSIETDDPSAGAMAEIFMALEGDASELMIEFLTNMQPGEGEPVITEIDRDAAAFEMPAAGVPAGQLNYTVPPGYFVIEQGEGYLTISNDPDADVFMEPAPGTALIAAVYGEEIARDLANFGLSLDDDPGAIAEGMAAHLAEMLAVEAPPISSVAFGPQQGYSFPLTFDDMHTLNYVISVDGVGAVLVSVLLEDGELSSQLQRDVVLFIVSMLQ